MAAFATTPAGITPNPLTLDEHRRNWQRLASWLLGSLSMDANGSIKAVSSVGVASSSDFLGVTGSPITNSGTITLGLTLTGVAEDL